MAAQQPGANVLLLPYCERLGIPLPVDESTTARWIVAQLSPVNREEQLTADPDQHARFKEELISNLTVQNPPTAIALTNLLLEMNPRDLFLEMVFNTNRYLIHIGLSWLDRCLPMLGNRTPNETLVVKVFQMVQVLRRRILLFLNHWKSSQATESPLSPWAVGLDTVQIWFERLFAFSWTVLSYGSPTVQREQWLHVTAMLLNDGFLIGEQPSQVIRTKTNCQVTLHHLGGETLKNKLQNSELKVDILSESQAQEVQRDGPVPPGRNSGHLEYDNVSLVYNPQTRMMSAEIKNLKIKKIIRPDRRGQECVLDEKFALLFYFTANSGHYSFMPRVLSLPIVVIVHVNQDMQASATVAWDKAAFEINRLPFYVPSRLSWSQIANVLNRKFKATTGRGLSAENLHFLCEKAVRETFPTSVPENQTITWSQFCKDYLPGREFTFWDWFYVAMKVTKDHFKQHWVAGHVIGFISKCRVEEYLRDRPAGTFIVRFSDSFTGAITISYVTAELKVSHVQPFTPRELESLPLAETINNIITLHCVYPDVPKATAFGPKSANSLSERRPPGYTGRRNLIQILDPAENGNGELGADSGTTNGTGVTLQPADSSVNGEYSGGATVNRQHADLSTNFRSLLLNDRNREGGGSTNLLDISYPHPHEPVGSTSRLEVYRAPTEPTPEPMEASSTTSSDDLEDFIKCMSPEHLNMINSLIEPLQSDELASPEMDVLPPEEYNGGSMIF